MGLPWYAEALLGIPAAVVYVWLVFQSARLERFLGGLSVWVIFAVAMGLPVLGFWFAPWASGVATGLGLAFLAGLTYLYSRPHR